MRLRIIGNGPFRDLTNIYSTPVYLSIPPVIYFLYMFYIFLFSLILQSVNLPILKKLQFFLKFCTVLWFRFLDFFFLIIFGFFDLLNLRLSALQVTAVGEQVAVGGNHPLHDPALLHIIRPLGCRAIFRGASRQRGVDSCPHLLFPRHPHRRALEGSNQVPHPHFCPPSPLL
jgi:hypothetical protein